MEAERKTFMATVMGNALQKSKVQGTASVAIRLRTLYDINDPDTPVKMNLIGNLWLTYKCMKQTIKTLQEAFGWKGHNITDFNDPILTGKKCQVVCDLEEWEGEERWGVTFINRPGGMRQMEGADLAELVADVQPMVDEMVGERTEIPREKEMPGAIGNADGEKEITEGTAPEIEDEDSLPF